MKQTQILGGIQLLRLTTNDIVKRRPSLKPKRLFKNKIQKTGQLEPKRLSNLKSKQLSKYSVHWTGSLESNRLNKNGRVSTL